MIIDKQPLPDDPTPTEAPPSYETVSSSTSTAWKNEKRPEPLISPSASTSSTVSPSPIPSASSSSSYKGQARASTSNSWFSFSASACRPTREIHSTILALVRDLVKEQSSTSPAAAAVSILDSCAEACTGYDISLSSILQEMSIEGHTPLYWAIVKRPPDSEGSLPDLLTSLISHATPLLPSTIADVRHACLLTSDQALFQRLRVTPEFAPMSGTDEMLLGARIPMDEVIVRNAEGGEEGAFCVDFEVVQFQKRMLVSKHIEIDFIARARMWRLEFSIASPTNSSRRRGDPKSPRQGSWCISLSLLEHSPPTYIDSRLLIPEPVIPPQPLSPSISSSSTSSPILTKADETPHPTSPTQPPDPLTPQSLLNRIRTTTSPTSTPKPRPTISIRLQSSSQLVAPPPTSSRRFRNRDGDRDTIENITVSLEEEGGAAQGAAASLQYAGTRYIAPDGTLRARLEARLGKAPGGEGDCVIC